MCVLLVHISLYLFYTFIFHFMYFTHSYFTLCILYIPISLYVFYNQDALIYFYHNSFSQRMGDLIPERSTLLDMSMVHISICIVNT